MNSFARFRERNNQRKVAANKLSKQFIFKGYPSIELTSGSEKIQAAVVNKQERDYAYVYTQLKEPLELGSVWDAKKLHLLISEEVIVIKDVDWNKYVAFLCNVQINNTWGYFLGPEKSYVNVALKQSVVLESQQKPLLVLPKNILDFNDKIVIKDRAWVIQEYDTISSPGLVYYSLAPSTVSKESASSDDVYVEKYKEVNPNINPTPILNNNAVIITPNTLVTVDTEDGFFKSSNTNIHILKRSRTSVTFKIPFGITECSIQVKQKGIITEMLYKIGN